MLLRKAMVPTSRSLIFKTSSIRLSRFEMLGSGLLGKDQLVKLICEIMVALADGLPASVNLAVGT